MQHKIKIHAYKNPDQESSTLYVFAAVNNFKLGMFIVDTGSTHTWVDVDAIKKWGKVYQEKDEPAVSAKGVNGSFIKGLPVTIPLFQLGSVSLTNMPALIGDILPNELIAGVI